jgi:hypothetical protein
VRLYFCVCIPTFFLLIGCQPTSLEDFQWEGSSHARLLLRDLQKIESRDDLNKIEPFLKKDFHKIVDVIIQARNFQQKNPEAEISFQNINPILNASLRDELKRIYEIEGGRECIERVQREAMLKLDAKERKIEKQSAFFPAK